MLPSLDDSVHLMQLLRLDVCFYNAYWRHEKTMGRHRQVLQTWALHYSKFSAGYNTGRDHRKPFHTKFDSIWNSFALILDFQTPPQKVKSPFDDIYPHVTRTFVTIFWSDNRTDIPNSIVAPTSLAANPYGGRSMPGGKKSSMGFRLLKMATIRHNFLEPFFPFWSSG